MTKATTSARHREPYVPVPGSGADRITRYLQTHPREELSRADLFEKFGIVRASVTALLEVPIAHGLILKGFDEENNVVWRAGPRLPELPAALAPTTPAAPTAGTVSQLHPGPRDPTPAAPVGLFPPVVKKRRARLPLYDPATIPLESGVAKPVHSSEPLEGLAQKLALRMTPGTSVLLLTRQAKTLISAARKLSRQTGNQQRWSVRRIDDTHSRVWRDA